MKRVPYPVSTCSEIKTIPSKKKEVKYNYVNYFGMCWCLRSDSNRHSSRNPILSRARLPIPPRRLWFLCPISYRNPFAWQEGECCLADIFGAFPRLLTNDLSQPHHFPRSTHPTPVQSSTLLLVALKIICPGAPLGSPHH